MANIMSLKDVRNNVHRNGFDLSFRNSFTAKTGELLPIMCKEVLPGDKWTIDLQSFTRTAPIQTAAFTRMREYFDFYFVPTSLLWDKFDNYIIQTNNFNHASSIVSAPSFRDNHPYFLSWDVCKYLEFLRTNTGVQNSVGRECFSSTIKLLNYLGYGHLVNKSYVVQDSDPRTALNIFPLAGYQKIYYDYFRFSQWETSKPQNYNFDYVFDSNSTHLNILSLTSQIGQKKNFQDDIFTMRYANYRKDMFMGVLPEPQFGDTAVAAPLSGTQRLAFGKPEAGGDYNQGAIGLVTTDKVTSPSLGDGLGVSVFALRFAESAQRWKEITNSGDLDFKEQMEKHWNVSASNDQSYKSQWLGGVANNIAINEVTNTNLATEDDRAGLAGKGVGSSSKNKVVNFNAGSHYGYLYCIYHVEPVLDYTSYGLSPMFTRVRASDYAIPEFDNIGMQPVLRQNLYFDMKLDLDKLNTSRKPVGYGPRYLDYKTSLDLVHGAFLSTLQDWVAPFNTADRASEFLDGDFDYRFFKIRPDSLDSIFGPQQQYDDTVDSDQFLVSVFFDAKAVRNLSVSGLPY